MGSPLTAVNLDPLAYTQVSIMRSSCWLVLHWGVYYPEVTEKLSLKAMYLGQAEVSDEDEGGKEDQDTDPCYPRDHRSAHNAAVDGVEKQL